ncbi:MULTISPECIES: hypothetical protein [Rhodococcus]|uniref:Uncharacterized protein n=1 Tax=Rhodococcus opacus RKJ300 = JCM 13270 TaxID=1165867 RepID=I0WNQ6_RHOOP|nr:MULTISPECIES: hypothetical protein [Rhodococcus]EID78022.1 hypothetical protein W59_20663 [Rhodococcus opacus RKJ300 = JCM 13270]QQZ19546.1 hypothetical protein GO592_43560 [Rhodococcus sp. 21391]
MPHFRYVGTRERIHLGAATRMINYGDIVAARTNPDPRYFELVEPDQITEQLSHQTMGAPERE